MKFDRIRPPDPRKTPRLKRAAARIAAIRGRPLFYDAITTGRGHGPYVELVDGSVKLDFITGIGVNFFGYGHPRLTAIARAAASSPPLQGHLIVGTELIEYCEAILAHVRKVSRLRRCFVSNSGAMANENALKILRQFSPGRPAVVAFRQCFHGRTQTMAELTDNDAIRKGLPLGPWRRYIPFHEPDKGWTTPRVVAELQKALKRRDVCAVVMELVQGEGGFRTAPPSFFKAIARTARKHGVKVWIDEIQTVGRTRSLFAFEEFGLGELVDVVTAGKMLQAGVTLFTPELTPDPGLLSQTFAGATVPLAVGTEMLRLLRQNRAYGSRGTFAKTCSRTWDMLEELHRRHPARISHPQGLGGMIAFRIDDGSRERTIAACRALFDAGLMTFYCGRSPHLVRMLPPLPVLTKNAIDEAGIIIDRVVRRSRPCHF